MQRVMIIGDGGCNTGFARVVRGVADHLHDTGDFEVVVRAINYRSNHTIPYAYDVQAVTPHPYQDPFGFQTIRAEAERVKPDVLFMVQDIWNVTTYANFLPRDLPKVAYFPVDCPNIKWSYALGLGAISEAVSYTHFGAREAAASMREAVDVLMHETHTDSGAMADTQERMTWLYIPKDKARLDCRLDRLARWQNPAHWNVVPHGMEQGLFEPRDQAACRRLFGLPEGAFVVGYVSTNQFRKRQDIAIRAFAQLLATVPEAWLVLHCAREDRQGWDLRQLARYYGVSHRILLPHQHYTELTDTDLCSLYNCFDVHINTSGGEGWGLCSFEAAACGIPQRVPDWSATRELWIGSALLAPVLDWRHEPKFLNTAHAILDTQALAGILRDLAGDPDLRQTLAERALTLATQQLSWSEVGAGFATIIDHARREGPPTPMAMHDVTMAREGVVESELYRRPV